MFLLLLQLPVSLHDKHTTSCVGTGCKSHSNNGLHSHPKRNKTCSAHTPFHTPYRNNEAPLLEVFHQRDGVLLEVGQAAVDGLGVVVRSSLLLGPFLQPLLQMVVGAGQEHHQVRSTDLPGEGRRVKHDSQTYGTLVNLTAP